MVQQRDLTNAAGWRPRVRCSHSAFLAQGGILNPRPSIFRGARDALGALPLFATAPLYRRWHMRWGATDEELRLAMPGDDSCPSHPSTPHAPSRYQRHRRGSGPGSCKWAIDARASIPTISDNAGIDSATSVLDEFQNPRLGDWMPMASTVNETTAFRFTALEATHWLLWSKPDSTWAWRLSPGAPGRTRLVSRLKQRYPWETPGMAIFTLLLLEFGDFPMMRRGLTG